MATRNISRPGETPVHEDWIEKDLDGGGTIQLQYRDPDWTVPEPETDEEIAIYNKHLAENARVWRNQQLAETDLIAQTLDYPNRDAYITFRQELRDWPSTDDFPATKPTLGS